MTDSDQIRNTIAHNNQLLDDRHYEECATTFTEDGAIGPYKGRKAILEFMASQGLGANPDLQRRHIVTNIMITIAGEEAVAISDLLLYDKVGNEEWKLTAIGRYTDHLAKQTNDTWLFTNRQLKLAE
jgi:3-phenylpropionate/cinnamic acid dioxygenase small subunit